VQAWPHIQALINDPLTKPTAIYNLEIHPADPCQNNCKYCRGELRSATRGNEPMLSAGHMIHAIEEAYYLNPSLYVRLSGSVGDPLVNPATLEVMKKLNELQIPWGITTNGLRLTEAVLTEMFSLRSTAEFVQVSLDAGSDETYIELKTNDPHKKFRPGQGPFTKVISNIQRLVERSENRRQALLSEGRKEGIVIPIFASVLVQKENYLEIDSLSQQLKALGVNGLQVKMQHFDPRRTMAPEDVNYLYDTLLPAIAERDHEPRIYKFMVVQDKAMAHRKNEGPVADAAQPPLIQIKTRSELEAVVKQVAERVSQTDFDICAAAHFGATLAANGTVNSCCNYFLPTIGSYGQVTNEPGSFTDIMNGEARRARLRESPRNKCDICSPTDFFINELVQFLRETKVAYPFLIATFEEMIFKEAKKHKHSDPGGIYAVGALALLFVPHLIDPYSALLISGLTGWALLRAVPSLRLKADLLSAA
jgi:sulfatase maturation enzyme AslB (radical SAM superfamily)